MESVEKVKSHLQKVTEETAKKLNLKNYTIHLNSGPHEDSGFGGDLFKVTITENESKNHHFVIKKALTNAHRREEASMDCFFLNEVHFYSEIIPCLKKFQEDFQVEPLFDDVPEYINGDVESGNEVVVFKDLTKEGYKLREKSLFLDDEHATLMFKTYGHFHALSFCLKELRPEEYQKITKPLYNVWQQYIEKNTFLNFMKSGFEEILQCLDVNKDEVLYKKFENYIKNLKEIYAEVTHYKGEHFCLVHGDCQFNNMMFKYKDKKLEAMKILDFQLCHGVGTPVYDLSYFFYTAGSKNLFSRLEDYLDIYYESFSECCKNFKCDPDQIFPRRQLTEDWKVYSRFGMLMGLSLTKMKLMSREDTAKIKKNLENPETETSRETERSADLQKRFCERVRDILLHAHEINIL